MLTESEFNEIQQRIMSAWHCGKLDEAFAEIDRVLRDGTPEMKGACLSYRAMIHESRGEWSSVKQDCLDALQYASQGTFLCYQLELTIGVSYEQQGTNDEAIKWYRKALVTCADGDEFSGHKTLAAFMRLTGAQLSHADETLASTVAEKSWRVLEVPREPNLNDLPATSARLSEHFSKTVEAVVEDSY